MNVVSKLWWSVTDIQGACVQVENSVCVKGNVIATLYLRSLRHPNIKKNIILFHVCGVCLYVCLAPHVYSAHGGQKWVSDALELDLQIV